VLKNRKGLINDGFMKYSRNPNYLGEIMLYSAFNIVAQLPCVWYYYIFDFGVVFMMRMIWKDYMLSKKEGWEEYKKQSWILIPKLYSSAAFSLALYAILTTASILTYRNGGIVQTSRDLHIFYTPIPTVQ